MISERYTWLLVILQVASTTLAGSSNSGNGIVSQRLLNRVADIIANGGDSLGRGGEDGNQNNEGPSVVDQELIERISRIISQNEGQLSWAHKKHARSNDLSGQPFRSLSLPQNSNDNEYGTPSKEIPENTHELAGSQFELSPPELVPRIASFDVNGDDDIGYSTSSQDSYSDNRNLYQGRSKLELEPAQNADRIASFDIGGETPPAPFRVPPQARNGYFSNTK